MAHRLASEAATDLDDIWYSVATQSGGVTSADRVVNELTRRIHLIAMYPHIGRARDELNIGLRGFPAGDYVILYRVENEDVFILRVLHGRRDIAYLMDE